MQYQETFKIDPKVKALGLRGRYFVLTGLVNQARIPAFDTYWAAQISQTKQWLQDNPGWKDDPVLAGFRTLHSLIGRSNRDFIASPENLLKLLTKRGDLPRINLVVDIYNLISLKYHLALGAHDQAKIDGSVRLALTAGNERYLPLGGDETKPIFAGEYAYIDDSDVLCRMEVRQAEKTKVGLDTTACFYIVQGNAATDEAYLAQATTELIALTTRFCGGQAHVLQNID